MKLLYLFLIFYPQHLYYRGKNENSLIAVEVSLFSSMAGLVFYMSLASVSTLRIYVSGKMDTAQIFIRNVMH